VISPVRIPREMLAEKDASPKEESLSEGLPGTERMIDPQKYRRPPGYRHYRRTV